MSASIGCHLDANGRQASNMLNIRPISTDALEARCCIRGPSPQLSQRHGRPVVAWLVALAMVTSACEVDRPPATTQPANTVLLPAATQGQADTKTPATGPGPGSTPLVASHNPTPVTVQAIIGPASDIATARLGRGNTDSLDLSPRGDLLVVVSPIGLFAYEFESLQPVWHVPMEGVLQLVGFIRDGGQLAVRSDENSLEVIDAQSGALLETGNIPGRGILGVAISPDGEMGAAASIDGDVLLWDLKGARPIQALAGHQDAASVVSFSPSGSMLASGGDDNSIVLWDTADGTVIRMLQGHGLGDFGRGIAALAFAPDGSTLASGGFDGKVLLWDVSSGARTELPDAYSSGIVSLAFSRDGTMLAVRDSHRLHLWQTDPLTEALGVDGVDSWAAGLAFSPSGDEIVSPTSENSVTVRDARTGDELRALAGAAFGPGPLAVSPNGQAMATCMPDHVNRQIVVQLWDSHSLLSDSPIQLNNIRIDMHADPERDECLEVEFTDDSRQLWVGHGRGAVALWDFTGHREVWEGDETIEPGQRFGWVAAVAFHGNNLAARSDYEKGIYITDLKGALPQGYLDWPSRSIVHGLNFSTDGTILAAGMETGQAELFDLSTRRLIGAFEGRDTALVSVRFSPGDAYLAGGYADGSLVLWEVASGKMLRSVKAHNDAINDLGFSPDATLLASASRDGDVRVWTLPGIRQAALLDGHASAVTGLLFLPNAPELVSSSLDGTAIIWPLPAR